MSLLKLIEPPIQTHLLPELENAVLNEVRNRYRNQINPELWKAHFDSDAEGEFSEDFINESIDIVEKILADFIQVGRIALLPPKHLEFVRETIWEKSQAYWYEYAPELESALSFIDRVSQSARREIDEMFPYCDNVFGPMAHSLLVDLSFQYEFYRFSKISKPDLIDLRRMINISGQIIESIFAMKIFPCEDLRLGKILDRLSKSRKDPDAFLADLSKDEASQFLRNLDTLNTTRNKYSHGTSNQENIDKDFQNCIATLIADKTGILMILYRFLKGGAGAPAANSNKNVK